MNAIVFGHVNELAWLIIDTCEVGAHRPHEHDHSFIKLLPY